MSTKTTSYSGGIGFTGLLGIVFITLKLTHVIAWSWLWVLATLWVPIGLLLTISAVILGVIAIVARFST